MQSWTDPHLTGAAFNLRGHPVFWALVSPAEKNRRERSDDRKYVCGLQASRHSPRRPQNAGRYKLIFSNFLRAITVGKLEWWRDEDKVSQLVWSAVVV